MPEPRPGLYSGSIPGSKNIFFKDLVDSEWKYKSDAELLQIFGEKNVDLEKKLITKCGSGLTAAMINYSLYLLGKEESFLYDQSWAEYGRIKE